MGQCCRKTAYRTDLCFISSCQVHKSKVLRRLVPRQSHYIEAILKDEDDKITNELKYVKKIRSSITNKIGIVNKWKKGGIK